MNKPLLLIITGRPASGKTTLARLISRQIHCPVISRDELKEGYINTIGLTTAETGDTATLQIYDTFFEAISLYISNDISVIAEAAFQDKLWKSKLNRITDKANIKIIICDTALPVAKARFAARLASDAGREIYHGDSALLSTNSDNSLLSPLYEPLNFDASTLHVDTTENYEPGLAAMLAFINQHHQQ